VVKKAAKRRGSKGIVLEVAEFRLDELRESGYNPRIISDASLAGLTQSIKRFGCVEPIVVNVHRGRRRIVGGHQRLKVLRGLGVEKILCVVVNCTVAEEKLLNLTLNNPEIQGQFIKGLDTYIDELRRQVGDPSVFADLQIDALYAGLQKPSERQGRVPDDDLPDKPKKAVTRPGDLWLLGEHRLLCGDSTNTEDVTRLMGKEKARLFATDPPYSVDYTHVDRPGESKPWEGVYLEVDVSETERFVCDFYLAGLDHIKPKTPLYLWHADARRPEIHRACEVVGISVHQTIIWVKPCLVLGYSYYGWRHEPCLLMWPRKGKPHPPVHANMTNKTTTVWPVGYQKTGDPTTPEYYSDVWELDWDGKKRSVGIAHPTVKPVECFAIPMRIHTRPGDVCYEPFCGSGTQIIAAEKLGRRCYALERQPLFVDVAVQRWEQWTGRQAQRDKRRRRGR
jgi:DNA modification methylase